MKSNYHLAQINIAELKAPIDDPLVAEFRESIDFVNETSRRSPGFVWLYQAEDGQSSSYEEPHFPNPLIVVNYSLWEDYISLHHFVYNTVHSYFLKNRKRWMSAMDRPHAAMWWVKAGEIPTIKQAIEKLKQLEQHGPGPEVFNLRQRFNADGSPVK
ncbi:hypothetical protein CEQ90_14400 [Lewinellaceae bacterium SD302]|nr:hypothetical protein CEQ90_14400 [Lewinellaceae bacterium SD302]